MGRHIRMNWDEITPLLEAPLDKKYVKPAKKFGPKGDYIEGWYAIDKANRLFGFGGWSYEITFDCVQQAERRVGKDQKPGWGVTYVCKVRVMVDGAKREDVGAGHGFDVDLGQAHEGAVKEAATDALKRALRTFGYQFGLALYDKSRENVDDGTPKFNPKAAAERIEDKLRDLKTMQQGRELWRNEQECIWAIKNADTATYDGLRRKFDEAGKRLIDDQAMQAPQSDNGDYVKGAFGE